MNTKVKSVSLISILLFIIVLTGCKANNIIKEVNTVSITNTEVVLTETPTNIPTKPEVLPTKTTEPPTPTIPETKQLITNTPITKWENIQIKKGAFNIKVDDESVSFSIKDQLLNVYNYYKQIMSSLGYKIFMESSGGKGKLSIYQKGDAMITIAIVPDDKDPNIVLVVITK